LTVNSLSRSVVATRPRSVSDTLLCIDLRDYKIATTAWERLGETGSSRNPLPEPYFHKVIETEEVREEVRQEYWPAGVENGRPYPAGYYPTRYKTKGKKTTIQAFGGWLPKADILSLVAATESQQPIYRADWFCYYALLEPRYHELLGLGETREEFEKAFGVNKKAADDIGSQARGAVLISEVATNNRILERTASIGNHGRAAYWESFDFGSSVNTQDVLTDVAAAMNEKADAHEIIASLRNGLQAYFLTNGQGRRIDRTDAGIARDVRNGFNHVEVEIRNCFACHGTKGILAIDDEVRAASKGSVAAAASLYSKRDAQLAERFLEKYAAAPLDELINADGVQYQLAAKNVTGMDATAAAAFLTKSQLAYERPMTLAGMAAEMGCTEKEIKDIVPRIQNVNSHVAAAIGSGRRVRREHWENGGYAAVAEGMTAAAKK
jgi:hypothetical protein